MRATRRESHDAVRAKRSSQLFDSSNNFSVGMRVKVAHLCKNSSRTQDHDQNPRPFAAGETNDRSVGRSG